MKSIVVFAAALIALPPLAVAADLKFGDLKDPVKLTAEELRSLATGATVTDTAGTGSSRRWENNAGGSFTASSSNAGGTRAVRGQGTWKINEDGRYCVEIGWQRNEEKWCQFVFRAADGKHYRSGGANSNALLIEFNK